MAEQGFSVRLTARVDQYLASMQQAAAATKKVSAAGTDLDKLGGQFTKVGSTLTSHVSLPLAAAGGIAVKMSSDFQSAFARMVGLAGVQADEVDGLRESVLKLAGETAKSPQELADALYEASSAGLDTAQAMDAVRVAAKASAAGMGSARDIVGLVASATAAYGSANIDAARATDILTSAIREGRADPAELAGTLGRVLPIANQLGVSFEEVGGATAYLSNVFGDTNRTVTALQGFLVKLVSPTQQGRDALTEMGTSAEELRSAIDAKGLLGALELLKTHGFDQNDQAMTKLFDDIEGRQGALALMADESGHLAEIMGATKDSAGSLDEAFTAVSDTAGFKMRQAWADLQVALIQAGDVIMPIVTGIAGGAADLASAFSGLPGPAKAIVIGFLAIVAAGGPVLMIAGSLIRNFNQVKTTLTSMSTGATSAGLALGALGLVMLGATAIMADNAAKKRRLREATDEFADALKREAEGQQGAIRASIAAQLSNKNIVDDAKTLGLSLNDLADIIEGKTVPAWDAWNKSAARDPNFLQLGDDANKTSVAWNRLSGSLDLVTSGLQGAKDEAALAAKVTDELGVSTSRTADQVAEQTANFNKMIGIQDRVVDGQKELIDTSGFVAKTVPLLKAALDEQAASADRDSEATKRLKQSLDDSTSSFDLLSAAASLLQKAFDAVFGRSQTLEDANETLLAAVDATTKSIKENGRTLDINTEKGRANRDAIQAQANAALATGVAMVGMGASNDEATAAIDAQIVALHDQLIAAGLTEDQVAAYIATLGLTPENVDTAITLADTEATKERIRDLQDRLGDIDAGAAALITADIEEGKFDSAESRLMWLARARDVILNLQPGTGLKLIFGEGQTPLIRFGYAALGALVPAKVGGTPYILGEGGSDEAVLPLNNRDRMRAMLSDPRVGVPVAAAQMGLVGRNGGGGAGPTVINRTVQFGDINNTVEWQAAWQQANFALAAA